MTRPCRRYTYAYPPLMASPAANGHDHGEHGNSGWGDYNTNGQGQERNNGRDTGKGNDR